MEPLNTDRIEYLALFFCCALLVLLTRLVMKRRLREEYIIVWIGVLIALLFFTIFRGKLDSLAQLTGIVYPPSLLFLFFFAALLFYCLHLSVVASKQSENIKELAQKIAILEEKVSSEFQVPSSEPRNQELGTRNSKL